MLHILQGADKVAIVLTVYGIETIGAFLILPSNIAFALQQYLPFTVLKQCAHYIKGFANIMLQQYLPFTVLKLVQVSKTEFYFFDVATVLTVYGIETRLTLLDSVLKSFTLQQYLPFMVFR